MPPSPVLLLKTAWHHASRLSRHPEFHAGAKEMVVISLGISAWGLVTGVAMIQSGLTIPLALFMSLAVFAGTSQLAALPLMMAGAPIWLICVTAFCVNLRFLIYSLQWRPYFNHLPATQRCLLGYFAADLNYIVFTRRFPVPKAAAGQVPYYLGGVCVTWLAWQVPSIVGIFLAHRIPTAWGLGFIGTLALLAVSYTMLTDRSMWIAAGVSACAALAFYSLPLNLNMPVAILAAVSIGLMLDRFAPPAARR